MFNGILLSVICVMVGILCGFQIYNVCHGRTSVETLEIDRVQRICEEQKLKPVFSLYFYVLGGVPL